MAATTEPTGDELAFLQRRVATFGLVAGAFALGFFVVRLLLLRETERVSDPSLLTHLGAGLSLIATWFALQGRKVRSARFVRTVELFGIGLASTLLVVMGSFIPLYARPGQIVVMALAVVHLSRAVYVPSTALRTALLAGAVGVALVIWTFSANLAVRVEQYAGLAPDIASSTPLVFALYCAVDAGTWWLVFGALASAASSVIYGLRKQVGAVRELGQYHIESELGAGAMGIVYRAHHALLRRETAVKVLPQERAGAAALERFAREVKLTARLKHPNTVTIYDYGRTPDGMFYYAMELLDGATLEQIVESTGPMPASRTVHVLAQAAGALAEAHELGLIHRDIKPANVMLCNQGGQVDVAKVLDFGLVKEVKSNAPEVTQANSITGTPLYMPPEALKDPNSVDARSDLYALGAVGYYLLAGDHVFTGNSMIEVFTQHLHEKPAPLEARTGRAVPAGLEQVVMACLEKRPADRPQTAREVLTRLSHCGIDAWSPEQAEAWWQEHAAALGSKRRSRQAGTTQTIQVDLGQRGSS